MDTLATLRNVTYSYPDREEPSLRNISLDLEPAEFILVLGSSGSGKSSLLRLLCGLIPHFHGGVFSGQAVVTGRDIRRSTARDLSQHVGLVFQDPENQAVMNSVEREIAFGLENRGTPSSSISRLVEESLISLGLSHLRRAPLRLLSGGELQKVALASVLAMQPRLLLLDEPTSQLDPISSEELLSTLRRILEDTGGTVVLAEHRAERCLHLATRVIYMDRGAIVHDSSADRFSLWALENHPEYLPPVTRLFRDNHGTGERGTLDGAVSVTGSHADAACLHADATGLHAGVASPLSRDGANGFNNVVPLTVQDARRFLETNGLAARPARVNTDQNGARGVSEPLLEVRGLSVGYRTDLPLLTGLEFRLHAGEFVALMGQNGCGKSTLVKHFNGLLKPLGGQVLLNGRDVGKYSVATAAHYCGLLGQNPNDYFVKGSVREELEHTLHHLGVSSPNRDRLIDQAIAELQLDRLVDCDPRDLSGGERSRVALGMVSVGRPPLMVLDEPTRGIDPPSKTCMGRILTEWTKSGRCVLLVTHDVEFAARYAQRIILLGDGGILADGTSREVLDGALYFSTQVNRLFRHLMPEVLVEEDVRLVRA